MNTQDHLLIEQYCQNTLGESEKKAFEQRMAEDPDFREEVNLHQRALKAIELHAKEAMQKRWKENRAPVSPKKPALWIVAAALMLISLAGFWFWNNASKKVTTPAPTNEAPSDTLQAPDKMIVQAPPADDIKPQVVSKPSPKKLYAQAYQTYKPAAEDGATHGDNASPTAPSTLETLKTCLREEKYEACLTAFDRLPQATQENLNALFYKANALMALDRTREAAPIFERIAASPTNIYAGEASWFLALIALKNEDLPQAKKLLQLVQRHKGASGSRQAAASRLLKALQ